MTPREDRVRDPDIAAAEWSVRRREGLGRAERPELQQWLDEGPANPQALEASDRVWDELGGVDLRALHTSLGGQRPAARRRAFPLWAAAAGVAVAAVVAAVAVYAPSGRAYSTGHGEVRAVTLADGSTVTLGARSKILVRFERGRREVALREGEAVFDVARDAGRPFEVRAADTRVTVLGTKFMVKAAPDRVRVDVIAGVVRVAKAENPLVAPFIRNAAVGERIVRGERLESPRGEDLKALAAVDPAEVAPWREGRLVYENASLAEVVDDLNRYTSTRVELADGELGALRVTAALNRDQAARFLESLPATLPVRIERRADGAILIR